MPRRTNKRNGPHPVDVHVGARVRTRRTLLGMSQEKLGDALGLTFQQVQKYERGANRIGASRLHEISEILQTPVAWFFAEYEAPAETGNVTDLQRQRLIDTMSSEPDVMHRRLTLELVRAFYKLPEAVQMSIFNMMKTLGRSTGEDDHTQDVA